jgi:NAD(P)-dependent dehydrogenase (short-subunit alcohol dehydrogenase family)
VIEVNLVSVLDLCRLTAPLLLAAPAASVINVASMYGIVASRGPMAAYNATKGAHSQQPGRPEAPLTWRQMRRCEAQPMRSASETMIPSGPRT